MSGQESGSPTLHAIEGKSEAVKNPSIIDRPKCKKCKGSMAEFGRTRKFIDGQWKTFQDYCCHKCRTIAEVAIDE